MNPYLTEQHKIQILESNSFADLFKVAQDILEKMPEDIYQVCGPYTTGPRTLKENQIIFDKTTGLLLRHGVATFDQIPFEVKMDSLKKEWFKSNSGYCMPLLLEFYLPLFETMRIKKFLFLPDWKTSFGSNWEHDQAKRLGIEIAYLPNDWLVHFNIETIRKIIL